MRSALANISDSDSPPKPMLHDVSSEAAVFEIIHARLWSVGHEVPEECAELRVFVHIPP